MADINTEFCRMLYKGVQEEVKLFDPTIKVSEAETYIAKAQRNGKGRWFTFKFRGFYWEGYADNAFDGKATAWQRYMAQAKAA